MKKIKLNVTREEDKLQNNIYYVCDKNIIISQLNLTINYEENNVDDVEIISATAVSDLVNNDNNSSEKKNLDYGEMRKKQNKTKFINIKICNNNDELNNLYFNNVISNLYNYIFENETNNLYINKNHNWYIFINIYIYEYTPYIYDHICNVINVHLSLLLIPICFYDFEYKWYRCIESYDELNKYLTKDDININVDINKVSNNFNNNNNNENHIAYENVMPQKKNLIQNNKQNGQEKKKKNETTIFENKKFDNNNEMKQNDILILDKYEQNKNIIINQLKNSYFDLFVEIKNKKFCGLFKRLLITSIPFLKTININNQYIYIIKFIDYLYFFKNTLNMNESIYYNIIKKHKLCNFNKCTLFENYISNDTTTNTNSNNTSSNNTSSNNTSSNNTSSNNTSSNEQNIFEINEHSYMLLNANNVTLDENKIKMDSIASIQFYYNCVINYCLTYFKTDIMRI
ncbi:conserved protein, unknown function [Hepatocystis sp. ex Piliocolobus tephrosceles]|nr:conserved protein, unknown function [Hepatocystis sp. ex Piliocolobus tephrosceles]